MSAAGLAGQTGEPAVSAVAVQDLQVVIDSTGTPVISEVSFEIARGEIFGVVGESGSGKTTVAQSVTRMVESREGTIRFRGQDITRMSPREMRPLRRQMQMIYQDPYESLDPRFRVRRTIAEPLGETKVFPPMVVQMVAVGEQTGAMDTMLSKIADFYEDEVDEATQNLLALLEPLIILFLGSVIGGIVIAMYMPIFDLISKLT